MGLVTGLFYLFTVLWLHYEQQHQTATTHMRFTGNLDEVSARYLNQAVRHNLVTGKSTNTTSVIITNSGGGTIIRRAYRNSDLSLGHRSHRRPPLDSLIDKDGNITGDVQFLLDFAIVGFGKCGTSTLMHLLAQHAEVACFRQEIWELIHSRPAQLVQLLYKNFPPSPHLKRGYKCPAEITEPHILDYYRKFWPRTKLIVGIRHPIWWFQSLYNFRVQNLQPNDPPMLHPNKLVGRCYWGMQMTCTERANFAYQLLRLGKQNGPSSNSRKRAPTNLSRLVESIVGHFPKTWYNVSAVPYHPNPVFLYETTQLHENQDQFLGDLSAFLGLTTSPLSGPIPSIQPGYSWQNASLQASKDALKISICHDEYRPVRRELLRLAKQTSEWILTDFYDAPTVVVSDKHRFGRILEAWKSDPCESSGLETVRLV